MKRGSVLKQFVALVRRNMVWKWRRSKVQVILEFLIPLVFIGILAIVMNFSTPDAEGPMSFAAVNFTDELPPRGLTGAKFYLTPKGESYRSILETALGLAGVRDLDIEQFTSANVSETAYMNVTSSDKPRIIGVNFGEDASEYTVRLQSSEITDTNRLFDEYTRCSEPTGYCSANSYLHSDFAVLQWALDAAIIRLVSGVRDYSPPSFKIQLMPSVGWIPSLVFVQSFVAMYIVFAFSFLVNFLMVSLVAEKEAKLREALRVMGMRDSAYWLSWLAIYTIIIFIDCLLCTLLAELAQFFSNSNMFLFFLSLFLYGLSIITLSFALTPFFSKADSAGGLAMFATILFSLLYFVVSMTRGTSNEDGPVSSVPAAGQWALSLLSPIAIALLMDQAIYLDVARGGMNFDNLDVGQFPVYAGLTMLAVDFVLYGLLAVYLDNVVPGEYGSRRRPLYFLSPSYWCPSRVDKSNLTASLENGTDTSTRQNQEAIHRSLEDKNTLRIFNIRKEFKVNKKTFSAVDGISLDIYEGQITGLLGHNGAGKSTLMNLLTGMLPPSGGTATIDGWDVSETADMDVIRQMTGLCPQHNILFPELTCRDHMQFLGRLRGIPESIINEQLPNQLAEVDLKEKIDTFAKDLSGGQKRKLSLALALVGDPKILFLDEPTAGMDPSTRRSVWNLLKAKREGRVILLTTHFMDEADILADRKAIMSKGQLKCVGSSLFLKNRFGLGYHLGLVVEPDSDHSAVTRLVTHHVPTASLSRTHMKELVYILPLTETNKFPGLLESVEGVISTKAENIGIVNYGISMTTLEEVFLKIGEDEEAENPGSHEDPQDLMKYISTANGASTAGGDLSDLPSHEPLVEGLQSQQFWAFFKLRFIESSRNPFAFFMRIIMPAIFIFAAAGMNLAFSGSTPNNPLSPTELHIDAGLYAYVDGVPASYSNPNATLQMTGSGGGDIDRFHTAMLSTGVHLSDLPIGINLSNVAPHHIGVVVLDNQTFEEGLTLLYNYTAMTLMYNYTAMHSLPAVINLVGNTFLSMVSPNASRLSVYSQNWPSQSTENWDQLTSLGPTTMLGIALIMVPSAFASAVVHDRELKCRTQLRVAGITSTTYWSVCMACDFLQFCIPTVFSFIILLAFQTSWLLHGGAALCLILVLFFFMITNILNSYVWSYAFTKKQTVMAVLPSVFIWMPMLPMAAVAVVDIFDSVAATIIHTISCILIPTYPLMGALNYLVKVDFEARLEQGNSPSIPVATYFKPENNLLTVLIVPLLHILVLSLCLRALEVRSGGGDCSEAIRCSNKSSKVIDIPSENEFTVEDEDDDVAVERKRVEAVRPEQTVTIVKNLQKQFSKNTRHTCQCRAPREETIQLAVKNVTFAVTPGEVFGLLGPNGAGKSTVLNTMTAEIAPTRGCVVVDGHNIHSNLTDAYQAIGYCPQEDALWEFLTLREHLNMYAAAQGIPQQDIESIVTYYLKALDIEEHAKKMAKNLSGGTKRKLSLIISLLGKPRVVLMDEPSTGMDPKSKRFLWDTISSSFSGGDKAAVLTTHYMEEADALCTRVGIMVNGVLVALGSTQHLKIKYGSGYILELKMSADEGGNSERLMTETRDFVAQLLPTAELLEVFGERLTYKVPQAEVKAVSQIFSALEAEKTNFGIEEYSFSQSTLEQVFLELAKTQVEKEDDDAETEGGTRSPSRLVSQTSWEADRGNQSTPL